MMRSSSCESTASSPPPPIRKKIHDKWTPCTEREPWCNIVAAWVTIMAVMAVMALSVMTALECDGTGHWVLIPGKNESAI
jgi:hypothetical protein